MHLAALSLFTAWFNFTFLLGKLPSWGIYINMILGISKDFIKFFLLYACTLIAFGFGFHVLCSLKEPFADPIESVLFTLAMMVGEFNYIDLVNLVNDSTIFAVQMHIYSRVLSRSSRGNISNTIGPRRSSSLPSC